jgi:hypothetical protein
VILVLLLIVVLWGIFLGPSLIRRLADRRSGDSIGSFHRQLGVLRRTGPALVPPAHRLETVEGGSTPTMGISGHPVVSSRPSLVVVRAESIPVDDPVSDEPRGPRRLDGYFRPAACKRRRDVLLVLTGAVLVTALIGVIPGARPALLVTAFAAAVLGGYVALLVHGRNAAVERQTKLRYLPAPALVPEHTIQVRRTATR